MQSQDKLPYCPSLDGLRGVAVLIVIIGHGVPKSSLSWCAAVGVDVFFVLSGFLITSLLLREFDRHRSIRFGNFYARRFLRLMPCLWIVVSCFLLFALIARPSNIFSPRLEAAIALSYTTNWAAALDKCYSPLL